MQNSRPQKPLGLHIVWSRVKSVEISTGPSRPDVRRFTLVFSDWFFADLCLVQYFVLQSDQFADPLFSEVKLLVQDVPTEGATFCRTLNFDELT